MILVLSSKPQKIIKYLSENKIKYLVLSDTSQFDDIFFNKIKSIKDKIEFGLVFNWGKIISSDWLSLFPFINIHYSLLPKYRGAKPVVAALLNQDKYTGITCHFVTIKLDAGDILCQKRYKIPKGGCAKDLNMYLDSKLSEILQELFFYKNKIFKKQGIPQKGRIIYAPKSLINIQNSYLNFYRLTAEEVVARVRAFNPEPLARFKIEFLKKGNIRDFIVHEADFNTTLDLNLKPGKLRFIRKHGMFVGTLLGEIKIIRGGLESKKILNNLELLALKGKILKVI